MLKTVLVYSIDNFHQAEGRLIGRASFHTKERGWANQDEVSPIVLPIGQAADCDKVFVTCGYQCFRFDLKNL